MSSTSREAVHKQGGSPAAALLAQKETQAAMTSLMQEVEIWQLLNGNKVPHIPLLIEASRQGSKPVILTENFRGGEAFEWLADLGLPHLPEVSC